MIESNTMVETGMKVVTQRDELAQKLGVVARAVSTRASVQILSGVLLRGEAGRLHLAAHSHHFWPDAACRGHRRALAAVVDHQYLEVGSLRVDVAGHLGVQTGEHHPRRSSRSHSPTSSSALSGNSGSRRSRG